MDITDRKITKIARKVEKFTVRTLRSEGLGTGEFDVIHAVRKHPGITQSEVCALTGFDKAAVARQTANLEEKGYLTRTANPVDGRSRLLYPTEKADNLKNSKASVETAFYEWLLEPLSEEDRQEFSRLLDIIYQRCRTESKAGFPEMEKIMKGRLENGNQE